MNVPAAAAAPSAEGVARFEQALGAHQRGDLAQARALYTQLLQSQPGHVEALHLLAGIEHSQGRLNQAAWMLSAALAINPRHALARNSFGLLLLDLKQPQRALEQFNAAIEQAARLKPGFVAQLHFNRGSALSALERRAEALQALQAALAIAPAYAAAHNSLGNALMLLGRREAALASYDRAVELEPDLAEAWNNRGHALLARDRAVDALASIDRAIALKPALAQAHNNRSACLFRLNRLEEALASADQALALNPDQPDALCARADVLVRLDRLPEARALFEQALQRQPGLARGHQGMGNIHLCREEVSDALVAYLRAAALDPGNEKPRWNASHLLLLIGELRAGWPGYEFRWIHGVDREMLQRWPQTRLRDCSDLAGRSVVIFNEQGLGDLIQFCRYATELQRRGAWVYLVVPKAMKPLLGTLEGVTGLATVGDTLPHFDLHCPLLSLPLAFGTSLDDIPAALPYLHAEPRRVQRWRERIGGQGFKVGIAWQGSTMEVDRGRSFPLALFEPLSKLPGVRLISLQKNTGVEQLQSLPAGMRVETLGDDFDSEGGAFVDSAAVIECLDLVISSDTAIAHLAGALGRPVWVALKHLPDWRWMLERDDSPWYPSMRLFRQASPGDWPGVFAAIERALAAQLAPGQALLPPHRLEPGWWFERGLHFLQAADPARAAACLRRCIELAPRHAEARFRHGNALLQLGLEAQALAAYQGCLDIDAGHAEACNNAANLLKAQGHHGQALALYDRALLACPDFATAHANRGALLGETGRLAEARASFELAVACTTKQLASPGVDARQVQALRRECARHFFHLGLADKEAGRPLRAVEHYDSALALLDGLDGGDDGIAEDPSGWNTGPELARATLHWNSSLALLLGGNFSRGWTEYEWRWQRRQGRKDKREFPAPLWLGAEPLQGRTLLLHTEQGLGDTLQFCRYAQLAQQAGAQVVLEVPSKLLALLRGLPGAAAVVPRGGALPAFDLHCPLLSLPLAFGTRLDNIPATVPYLRADPARVEHWRQRIGAQGLRVGIAWQGSTGPIDQGRSFGVDQFLPLQGLPGLRLISLQKNAGSEQLDRLPPGLTVETLGADFDLGPQAFLDSAAALMSLDLLITSDTALAHLAGALGVPVWVALKKVPDWRWLLDRDDSPWYPTMRLFRQPSAGDWPSVFTAIRRELEAWASTRAVAGPPAVEPGSR